MKTVMALALIAAPLPALAQTPAPEARPSAAKPDSVDPARLAAARPVAMKVWPLGTYKRMMSGTMDRMMDAVMESMMGMKLSDFAGAVPQADGKAKDTETKDALGDTTMGDVAAMGDPHFSERMKITTRVMFEEMGTLMARAEPDVQVAVAYGLARRFTVAELAEIDRFFSTPLGVRYAGDSMLLATEPEMIQAMAKFMPDFMKAMPAIMKKVEQATAHLPPPPKPASDADTPDPEKSRS